MLKQDQVDSLTPIIRTSQIINAALIIGLVGFAGVLAIIIPWNGVNIDMSILTAVGLLMALPTIGMAMALPKIITASAAKQLASRLRSNGQKTIDESTVKQCAVQFQTTRVIQMSLIEGAAFMNLIIFLVDKSLISLMVVGICVVMLAIGFPTTNRVVDWIDNQLDRVQDNM